MKNEKIKEKFSGIKKRFFKKSDTTAGSDAGAENDAEKSKKRSSAKADKKTKTKKTREPVVKQSKLKFDDRLKDISKYAAEAKDSDIALISGKLENQFYGKGGTLDKQFEMLSAKYSAEDNPIGEKAAKDILTVLAKSIIDERNRYPELLADNFICRDEDCGKGNLISRLVGFRKKNVRLVGFLTPYAESIKNISDLYSRYVTAKDDYDLLQLDKESESNQLSNLILNQYNKKQYREEKNKDKEEKRQFRKQNEVDRAKQFYEKLQEINQTKNEYKIKKAAQKIETQKKIDEQYATYQPPNNSSQNSYSRKMMRYDRKKDYQLHKVNGKAELRRAINARNRSYYEGEPLIRIFFERLFGRGNKTNGNDPVNNNPGDDNDSVDNDPVDNDPVNNNPDGKDPEPPVDTPPVDGAPEKRDVTPPRRKPETR